MCSLTVTIERVLSSGQGGNGKTPKLVTQNVFSYRYYRMCSLTVTTECVFLGGNGKTPKLVLQNVRGSGADNTCCVHMLFVNTVSRVRICPLLSTTRLCVRTHTSMFI